MRRFGIAAVFAATTATLACPCANAFEKQWHAGGSLGLGRLHHAGDTSIAPTADLALTFGLTDQINLLGEINVATARLEPSVIGVPAGRYELLAGQVGIAYTLDVLQWVPYAGVLAGGGRLASGDTLGSSVFGRNSIDYGLALTLAAGLDYQLTRDIAFGGAFRMQLIRSTEATSLVSTLLRVQYTWGY